MTTTSLVWNGWLHLTRLPHLHDVVLWTVDTSLTMIGEVDESSARLLGGHMVERRPDRMDCEHIPNDLLSKLYDDLGQMRGAVIPVGHRSVLFVEGHDAMFYRNYRLPIRDDFTDKTVNDMLDRCDHNQADPDWLMCWRCRVCGGYTFGVPGKDRLVEFFTGMINKDFSNIDGLCKLPDDYLAKTCVDCGDVSIDKEIAKLVGIRPTQEELKAYTVEKERQKRQETGDRVTR